MDSQEHYLSQVLDAETVARLMRKCAVCNDAYAEHRAINNACPIRDPDNPSRIIIYSKVNRFKSKEDEDEDEFEGTEK